jgi:hypothetical protein
MNLHLSLGIIVISKLLVLSTQELNSFGTAAQG